MAKRENLIDAIQGDEVENVRQILDDPNSRMVSFEELQAGCWQGNLKVVNLLLDHGGSARLKNVDAKDGRGVLHSAAQLGNTSVCKLFLELGVDPKLKDKEGRTAADLADEYNDPPNALSTLLRNAISVINAPAASPLAAPKVAAQPPPVVATSIAAKKSPVSPVKPAAPKLSVEQETELEIAALLAKVDAEEAAKKKTAAVVAKPSGPKIATPKVVAKPVAKPAAADDMDPELAALLAQVDAMPMPSSTLVAKAAAQPTDVDTRTAKEKAESEARIADFIQSMVNCYGSKEGAAKAMAHHERTGEFPEPEDIGCAPASDRDSSYSSSSSSSSHRAEKVKKVCGACKGSGQSRCNFCSGTGQFQKKRCTHCKGGSNKCNYCNGRG